MCLSRRCCFFHRRSSSLFGASSTCSSRHRASRSACPKDAVAARGSGRRRARARGRAFETNAAGCERSRPAQQHAKKRACGCRVVSHPIRWVSRTCRFSRGRRPSCRPRGQRARAAHALQAVRGAAPVPHSLRRRVRRAADLQRIFIFDIGGPHTYRTIYMDGRSHPESLDPSYYGHSIGWWDGDTLVVDTVGFNEGFWMDREGRPHTNQLHTLEKFTRTNFDDAAIRADGRRPGRLHGEVGRRDELRWESGTELFEYVCQQSNYAGSLMLGAVRERRSRDPHGP